MLSGKSAGSAFALEPGGSYVVGSRKANEIQLRDKGVSYKHALVTISAGGEVSVEDLGAKGGTRIGDRELDKNASSSLRPGQSFVCGDVELVLEDSDAGGSGPAPAPAQAAEPAPSEADEVDEVEEAEEPEEAEEAAPDEPEPDEPDALEPEPAPRASEAGPLPSLTPLEELPNDPALLKERFRELERRYVEKAQEARAYEEALESATASSGDDGLGGYSDTVSGDLEDQVLSLQLAVDEQAAVVLEKDEELKQLRREIEVLQGRLGELRDRTERERESIAEDILRGHERLEERKTEAVAARAEVAEFEQLNAELLLETEDLKEKLGVAHYQLEQERAQRGQLVRERLVELRVEAERLEAANAELRTLVEAYEEKIDELDERVEELEGESEAHDSLVSDLRQRLTKTEQDRDVMVKTLRKKLQGLERKLERVQGEQARARAATEAGS